MLSLHTLTIKKAHEKLKNKEISAVELTQSCLDRIAETDKKLNAFLTVTGKEALEQAKAADKKIAAGSAEPLTGIPLAIKDVILVKDVKNTAGSKILENYIATYDATVIRKLKEASAVIIGKTNCDEFAMGSSTENSAYGVTKNPWDLERVPGGSSGGSAAAVRADQCLGALGSDTGGSIRQPAALCGNVGLKLTYGRVSRYGLSALASSFDQIGPFGKTVTDTAWIFNAIAGHDEKDSTSLTEDMPDLTKLSPQIKGKKIGIPEECFVKGLNPKVKQLVEDAVKTLEKLGAKVDEVSLPHLPYSLPTYYIIMPAEASSNLARYDGIRYGRAAETETDTLIENYLKNKAEGFGDETKRRIMLGTYTLSSGYYDAYYTKAQKVRTKIIGDFKQAFKEFDLLITPTVPDVAFKIGEKSDDPLAMYLNDILTVSANVAGVPAISLPCGFVNDLPVGLQMIGNYYQEETILEAALAYEMATDWNSKKPKF
ncbi:MAG: Asp-tRNA(Asn)/Glu-tRNA(Gln) amidotransferase subunit GatA [Parcubacteria group bacterium]|nr:Asp-tRNA(Asn)/Glu-tRNA(Gln) amidotransferase subunit GatA [Parcubacteria group bacterium]